MMHLSDFERDTLKEIASIGAGNASRALSKIINQTVDVNVQDLRGVSVEMVGKMMGDVDQVITVVAVKILGGANGVILLLLTPEEAKKLISTISLEPQEGVLEEIANILVGSSLTALAAFLQLNLRQSIPGSATDMLGAIINEIVSDLGEKNDEVLVMEIKFEIRNLSVGSRLYFIFDPSSSQMLIGATKTKLEHHNG